MVFRENNILYNIFFTFYCEEVHCIESSNVWRITGFWPSTSVLGGGRPRPGGLSLSPRPSKNRSSGKEGRKFCMLLVIICMLLVII